MISLGTARNQPHIRRCTRCDYNFPDWTKEYSNPADPSTGWCMRCLGEAIDERHRSGWRNTLLRFLRKCEAWLQ